jgi:hypothetical protein
MQQGRFRREDMIIHHPGAQPYGYVQTLVTTGVDQFCLAGMVWFWKALKPQRGENPATPPHTHESCARTSDSIPHREKKRNRRAALA